MSFFPKQQEANGLNAGLRVRIPKHAQRVWRKMVKSIKREKKQIRRHLYICFADVD